jgi:hypothetical protein
MQSQTPGGTWVVIEAQVKNTLEQADFKNIQSHAEFVYRPGRKERATANALAKRAKGCRTKYFWIVGLHG